jgi:hypothetical protein
MRKEKREKKKENTTTTDDIDLSGSIWPDQIKTVYLDGNFGQYSQKTCDQEIWKKHCR